MRNGQGSAGLQDLRHMRVIAKSGFISFQNFKGKYIAKHQNKKWSREEFWAISVNQYYTLITGNDFTTAHAIENVAETCRWEYMRVIPKRDWYTSFNIIHRKFQISILNVAFLSLSEGTGGLTVRHSGFNFSLCVLNEYFVV